MSDRAGESRDQTIGARLATQYPDSNEGLDFAAVQLHEAMVGDIRKAMLVLFGAVGFVLLIACVNVANLLLAKAAAHESPRLPCGPRLAQGEDVWFANFSPKASFSASSAGCSDCCWPRGALKPCSLSNRRASHGSANVRLDPMVVGFTVAVSLVTGLRVRDIPGVSFNERRPGGSVEGKRPRRTFVANGVTRANSAGRLGDRARGHSAGRSGLLVRSFTKLAAVDPGFNVQPALTFELTLPDARYEEEPQQIAFFDQLLPKLGCAAGSPGGGRGHGPPANRKQFRDHVRGRRPSAVTPAQQPAMQIRVATTKYFQLIGIPLKRGRLFIADDRAGSPPVVVITEAAARKYFPNEDPIGKKITLGWGRGPGLPRAGGEVVGVVGDIKDAGLAEADPPQLYMPTGNGRFKAWPSC